jgi:hypothetical protein
MFVRTHTVCTRLFHLLKVPGYEAIIHEFIVFSVHSSSWESYQYAYGCCSVWPSLDRQLFNGTLSWQLVQVEGIDWMEPVLVWASICIPTGSGKSTLCKLLRKLVHETRSECGQSEGPFWLSDDQSFEKLGWWMTIVENFSAFMMNCQCFLPKWTYVVGRMSQIHSKWVRFYNFMDWTNGFRRTGMLFGKKSVWPHHYD